MRYTLSPAKTGAYQPVASPQGCRSRLFHGYPGNGLRRKPFKQLENLQSVRFQGRGGYVRNPSPLFHRHHKRIFATFTPLLSEFNLFCTPLLCTDLKPFFAPHRFAQTAFRSQVRSVQFRRKERQSVQALTLTLRRHQKKNKRGGTATLTVEGLL
ncbi:hypothetical protein BDW74DRAFT_60001 [Aspergillus multicolor]|uniref:uncharacterized protein n=1 Tax=Aspergillus multicolor TaxID=41759 RepID=UPI003CCE4B2F